MTSRVTRACSFAVVLLALAALATCNAVDTPPPGAGAALTLAGPIVFQRSGGIAGFDDRIEIQPSGEVHRDGALLRTLPQDELERLAKAVGSASDGPLSHGADQVRYSIAYGGKTVRWTDAATPEALAPVMSLLFDLTQP
jgi:hypothetical protein